MADVIKYTDNTGNKSATEENVTATTSKLFIPAHYEIFGYIPVNTNNAQWQNPYEADYQEQYDYYKNGASTIRYKHNATGTACRWWLRSPSPSATTGYGNVSAAGNPTAPNAHYSYGLVPCFAIA